MDEPPRRGILAAGAAATALATAPALFAQQTGLGGTGARLYEKGSIRIAYQEADSGASSRICAMPPAASPPARLRSTGRGILMPMTISV